MPSLLNVAECQNDMLMSAAASMRFGLADVADVEQQAVAAARAAGEPDVGIDGDVVALIRSGAAACRRPPPPRRRRATTGRRQRRRRAGAARHRGAGGGAPALGAGAPRPPRTAAARLDAAGRRRQAVEDARRADDRRLLRRRERHLDHFEAEARRVRIVDRAVRAAGQLVRRAHAAPSRTRRCRRSPCRSDRSPRCACASRGRSARWSTYFGLAMSVMSKMRMPRSRSLLTGSGTP